MTDSGDHGSSSSADPFTSFFSDLMSKMAMPGAASAAPTSPMGADFSKQMRQSFFDSMSSYCDDFMRSEQFLTAMRQSMDGALAFRQQLDRFLTSTVRSGQQPAREDTDHILLVLRSMEERVIHRLDGLEERLDRLEIGAADRSSGSTDGSTDATPSKKTDGGSRGRGSASRKTGPKRTKR